MVQHAFTKTTWLTLVAAAALTACGGGGSDTTPPVAITSVKVMGDSLADSGTFGLKFTVQGSAATGTGSTPIWPERVAASYGVSLCPYYVATGATTFSKNTNCTNYAVGGGRINNFTGPAAPTSITQQMQDAGARGFGAQDLVVLDGGGNDAADLIGAFVVASSDGAASYSGLLKTLLPAATVDAAVAAGATGMAQVGGAYMQALATKFSTSINTNVVGKGATRVVVLNMPSIYNTPRLQQLLKGITASAGAAAAAQVLAVSKAWIEAFNAQLATNLAGSSVQIADFYTDFNTQVANPTQFGLTNATTPACPVTGVGTDGLPTYTFPTCTAAALSAMTPPAGATGGADWWKTYAFSDSFHPTPYGHELLGQMVSRVLSRAGWL